MNVAILNLTGGGLSGGYAKYLNRLIPLLHQDPRIGRLDIFVPSSACESLKANSEVKIWPIFKSGNTHKFTQQLLHEVKPDVAFIPTARWINCGSLPTVVMIRNMEPLEIPFGGNSLQEGFKNLARVYTAWQACRKANRIIAVSQHVEAFLANRWGINKEKIGLVYHGIEEPLIPNNWVKPPSLTSGIIQPFIFTAGSIRPARGLDDIIQALPIVLCRFKNLNLVIAGEPTPDSLWCRQKLEKLSHRLGVSDRIVWTGSLSAAEMAWCFQNSDAFIMTSRAEACPNTALEAMSYGCHIISTNQAPMPEFFMNTALYYEPKKFTDLAVRVNELLDAPSDIRQRHQIAAMERAQDFDWRDTAKKTVDQLELALSQTRCY